MKSAQQIKNELLSKQNKERKRSLQRSQDRKKMLPKIKNDLFTKAMADIDKEIESARKNSINKLLVSIETASHLDDGSVIDDVKKELEKFGYKIVSVSASSVEDREYGYDSEIHGTGTYTWITTIRFTF